MSHLVGNPEDRFSRIVADIISYIFTFRFSKILMKKDPSQPRLQVKGPPKSFFEADGPENVEGDHRIPSEVLYMLRSVR